MNAREIKKLLDSQPFQPFEVRMSNGTVIDVRDEDHVFVMSDVIVVGIDPDEDGLPRRSRLLNVAQINEVQTLAREEAA